MDLLNNITKGAGGDANAQGQQQGGGDQKGVQGLGQLGGYINAATGQKEMDPLDRATEYVMKASGQQSNPMMNEAASDYAREQFKTYTGKDLPFEDK